MAYRDRKQVEPPRHAEVILPAWVCCQGDGAPKLRSHALTCKPIIIASQVGDLCAVGAVEAQSPDVCREGFSYPPGLQRERKLLVKGAVPESCWVKE